MASTITIKKGNTRKAWISTLLVDGSPMDLTGCTVKLHLRPTSGGDKKIDGAVCTIVGDPTSGVVRYVPSAADVDTAGTFEGDYEVTDSDGLVDIVPDENYITVTVKNNKK